MTEERNYKVYVHENKINGKKYIGITRRKVEERWGYKGNEYVRSVYFWNAIQKYGWDTFSHEVLFQNLTGIEANELEKILIKVFKTNNREYGYNIQSGGSAIEARPADTYKKLSTMNKGRKVSEETRRKISEHHADVSGKNNPMYGVHPWSFNKGKAVVCLDNNVVYVNVREIVEKTGLKEKNIRSVLSGRMKSTGGFRFIYLENYEKDKWYSPDVGNFKGVICTDTMEIFKSIKECAKKFDIDNSSITKVCKGKKKCAKGYHFQYWRGQKVQKTNRLHRRAIVSVKCLNNGKVYKSIKEAAKDLNLDTSNISKVCRNKKKQTKGYNFEYVTP